MKSFIATILGGLIVCCLNAKPGDCALRDMPAVYPGMTYGEFFEKADVAGMHMLLDPKEKRIELEEYKDDPEINQVVYVFTVDQWNDIEKKGIPDSARLVEMEVSYELSVDVKTRLMDQYGAPALQTMPEIGQIYSFDNQWNCSDTAQVNIEITHIHRRVRFKLKEGA